MVLGGKLLFQATDDSGVAGLWSTDGTASGTTELQVLDQSVNLFEYYSASPNTVVNDGIIYFEANDGLDGTVLWQSDGTPAGTFLVDVNDPGATSGPAPLAVVNGKVVFMATDGSYGTELLEVQSTSQTAVPQIAAIPDQEATVGEPFQLAVGLYASDPNVPATPADLQPRRRRAARDDNRPEYRPPDMARIRRPDAGDLFLHGHGLGQQPDPANGLGAGDAPGLPRGSADARRDPPAVHRRRTYIPARREPVRLRPEFPALPADL